VAVRSKTLALYRAGLAAAAVLPGSVGCWLAESTGQVVARLPDRDGRRAVVASHMTRVVGHPLEQREVRRMVAEVYSNYARYWAESLRLPSLAPDVVIGGVTVVGQEHLDAALARGKGVVLAAPHLGGWEWGAMYLVARGLPVTVAVEALKPPEVFEWFVSYRERLGMQVVPVGPGAGAAILRALKDNHVVCLLSDRLVSRASGVEVSFFGAKVEMPAGPVTLALRSGAPLLPAAIYTGRGADAHTIVYRPVLELPAGAHFRDAVRSGTQELAWELEALVRKEPTQWHLVQPNWPGDPELRTREGSGGRACE